MRILQILPTYVFGDAIGNEVTTIYHMLQTLGYRTAIYAKEIRIKDNTVSAHPYKNMLKVAKEDVVIFHLSIGDQMIFDFAGMNCKKILRYHNITPPKYFSGYNPQLADLLELGQKAIRSLCVESCPCLADSEYNRQCLVDMGYDPRAIEVLPIILAMGDYAKQPSKRVIRQYQDGRTNILFTGRIAPNKKHEDIIAAFYQYKRYYDQSARLFLVGTCGGTERYQASLEAYVKELGLSDVHFTGHIPFDQILAYYCVADIFLCMSEHEGFCVPLIEAMYFDVPIVARATSAIPDTLSGCGFLLEDNDPLVAAGVMHRIVSDTTLRNRLIAGQHARLKDFSPSQIEEALLQRLMRIIGARGK